MRGEKLEKMRYYRENSTYTPLMSDQFFWYISIFLYLFLVVYRTGSGTTLKIGQDQKPAD